VGSQLGEELADLHAALPVFLERKGGSLKLAAQSVAAVEATGKFDGLLRVVLDHLIDQLAVVFGQQGFGIEGVHLRGTARAENLYDAFGFRREMRRLRSQRRGYQRG
jgi:hypothetical protein